MLETARIKNSAPAIQYRRSAMEELTFPAGSFDVVLSSLALHYVRDFGPLVENIFRWLTPGGAFVFSSEHPVFTAQGPRTGSMTGRGTSGISRWTGILWKGSGTPAFWGNTW